jgi:hypothetical protein
MRALAPSMALGRSGSCDQLEGKVKPGTKGISLIKGVDVKEGEIHIFSERQGHGTRSSSRRTLPAQPRRRCWRRRGPHTRSRGGPVHRQGLRPARGQGQARHEGHLAHQGRRRQRGRDPNRLAHFLATSRSRHPIVVSENSSRATSSAMLAPAARRASRSSRASTSKRARSTSLAKSSRPASGSSELVAGLADELGARTVCVSPTS